MDNIPGDHDLVLAGAEKFKPLDYAAIIDSRQKQNQHEELMRQQPVKRKKLAFDMTGHKAPWEVAVESKTLILIQNGDEHNHAVKMLFTKRDMLRWDQVIQTISDRMDLGRRVTSVC